MCSQLLSDHLRRAHNCGVRDPFRDRYLRGQVRRRIRVLSFETCERRAGLGRSYSREVASHRLTCWFHRFLRLRACHE
jgi:hypothetical protein